MGPPAYICRKRVSVMTTVTSNRKAALQKRKLPLEVLFLGKSPKKLKSFKLPSDMNISVQLGPKGSYRAEHVQAFCEKWLDEWSPEREKQKDYRILYLDSYRGHLSPELDELCWQRGYVLLIHYGCTTGVAQVNDTDLHDKFEQIYLELEQDAFTEAQSIDPSDISRTEQEVLNDVAQTWRQLDHLRGVEGHKRVGLANALDGTDDEELTREALEFWECANMPAERKKAIAEVDALFAAGELSWASCRSLIKHPVDPGIVEEGGELEPLAPPGEKPYAHDGEKPLLDQDEFDVLHLDVPDKDEEKALVVAAPGDDPAEVAEAELAARRLQRLRRIGEVAVKAKMPLVNWHVEREQARILKANRGGVQRKKQNAVLSRHLRLEQELEAEKLANERKKAREHRQMLTKLKDSRRKKALLKKQKEKEKKDKEAAIKKLPADFTPADCGEGKEGGGGKKERLARKDCLERLHLRAPPLSLEWEVKWPKIRDAWAKRVGQGAATSARQKYTPVAFLREVKEVITSLGRHLIDADPKAKEGDPVSFLNYVKRIEKRLPRACEADVCTI